MQLQSVTVCSYNCILVSFELVPVSFKFVSNSSPSNSHNGGGWGVVVVGDGGGGGIADESFGTVLLSMSVWCLFVSGDER